MTSERALALAPGRAATADFYEVDPVYRRDFARRLLQRLFPKTLAAVRESEGGRNTRPPKTDLCTLLRIIAHHETPHIFTPGPRLPKSSAIVDGLWVACRGLAAECMFDGRATIELAERLATSWLTAIRLILVWHPVYALGQQHEPLERICRQGREYIAMLSGTIQTSYATWPFWQMMQRCLDWCCSFHIPDDRSCEHGSPRLGIQLEGENQIFAPSLGLYSAVMAWTPIPCHVQVPVFPRPGESDDVSTPPSGAQIGRVRPHSLQRLALKHRPIDADVHRPMPLGRPLPSMHMDDPDDPQPGPSGQGRAPRTPTLEGVRVAEQPVSLRRARTPPPPLNVDEDDNDLPPGQPPRPHLRTPPSSPSSSETEIDEELNAQPDPWGTNRSSTPTDNSSASEDEARGSGLPRPLRSATTEPRVTRRSRREARSRSRSRSGDRRWGPSRLRSMPGRRRASRQDTVLVDSSEEEP